MKAYSAADETRLKAQAMVREWLRSGLITAEQSARMRPDLEVDLRRTNIFLRVTLFVFTLLLTGAAVGLTTLVFKIRGALPLSIVSGGAGIATYWFAAFLVRRHRLYRFGVEEALAMATALLAGISAYIAVEEIIGSSNAMNWALTFAVIAAVCWLVYRKFGYLYAAIGAILFAGFIPLEGTGDPALRRFTSAALLAAIFGLLHLLEPASESEESDSAIIRAAAWAAVYLVLNFQFDVPILPSRPLDHTLLYWISYGIIWLLPVAGLWLGLRRKDRAWMDVNLALLLVTLASNKSYLGLEHKPWDPIVFGALLLTAALLIRRRLATGTTHSNRGFTATRLTARERDMLSILGSASVAFRPHTTPPQPSSPGGPAHGGGRSGGAGASGTF